MPSAVPAAARLLSLLLACLPLAGCESDAAELAREINAAREGCTQEKLQAGDEECVRMMQRYAEMGTEVMQTYIGAVRALDQALQRMPPAQLDTAGLGHAITPTRSAAQAPLGDSLSRMTADGAWEYSVGAETSARRDPRLQRRWSAEPEEAYDPRDERGYDARGYDPRGRDARLYDPRDYDARDYDRGAYDPRYPPDAYGRAGYGTRDGYTDAWDARREDAWDDRRPGVRGRPTYGGAEPDPGRYPPERGRLLPPEQRLRRPWIRDEEPLRDRRPRPRGSALEPYDTVSWREVAPPRPGRAPQH